MAPSCHRSKQPPTPASKVAYPPLVNPLRLLPALALSTFALVAVSACGEQTRASNPATATDTASASSDEAQIRAVVADWVSAIEDQDYAKACALQTKQNTKAMLEEMADSGMTFTCPQMLEGSTAGSSDIDSTVTKVRVTGSTATAMVGMSGWRFAEIDGEWLISHLD